MAYKRGYPLVNFTWHFRMLSFFIFYVVSFPVALLVCRLIYAVRYEGRETLLQFKGKAILVSNHATLLDPVMVCGTAFPYFVFHTLLEKTITTPFLGMYTRLLGGIPLSAGILELEKMLDTAKELFKNYRYLHFYPEGECYLYNQQIMPFKYDAFYIAAKLDIPVIPIVTIFSENTGKKHPLRKQKYPNAVFVVLDPVLPEKFIKYSGEGELDLDSVEDFTSAIRLKMQTEIDDRRVHGSRQNVQTFHKEKQLEINGGNE